MKARTSGMQEVRLAKSGFYLRDAAGVRAVFRGAGVSAAEIVEQRTGKCTAFSFYTGSLDRARQVAAALRRDLPDGMRLSLRGLRTSEWRDKWKRDIRPVSVGGFRIVPYWMRRQVKKAARDIVIDTSVAFGTGLHPTTQSMIRLIAAERGKFRSFLDIGTGSGILTLVASRCGAKDSAALDVSEDALRTARRNFALNRRVPLPAFGRGFEDIPPGKQFDLIAANILAPVLVRLKRKILASLKSGGCLAVSGIWKDNRADFEKAFASPGLRMMERIQKNGWMTYRYVKAG